MKEIQLTRGYVALVDDEDFEWLNRFSWHANITKSGYVSATKKRGSFGDFFLQMSRMVLGVTDTCVLVDHIDRDPLNNQKSNLRTCNKSQNRRNSKSVTGSTSRYLGVSFNKPTNKWIAHISENKKQIYLGVYDKEEDAAMAFNKKALEICGEFASLNIIT